MEKVLLTQFSINYYICPDGKLINAKSGRVMKPCLNKGYLYYKVYTPKPERVCKRIALHRMVAENFVPNPLSLPVVNHRNGIKTDNRIQNLEWTTIMGNTAHYYNLITSLRETKYKLEQEIAILKQQKSALLA